MAAKKSSPKKKGKKVSPPPKGIKAKPVWTTKKLSAVYEGLWNIQMILKHLSTGNMVSLGCYKSSAKEGIEHIGAIRGVFGMALEASTKADKIKKGLPIDEEDDDDIF